MEQSRLKRHAALAIVMVGIVTALVAIGRILSQGGDPDEAQTDEQDSWHRFSSGCASHRLITPPPEPETMAVEPESKYTTEPPKTLIAVEEDFRGCGDREEVVDFWTADIQGLYTPAVPVEKPGEERR